LVGLGGAFVRDVKWTGRRLYNMTLDSSNFIVKGVSGSGSVIPTYTDMQMFFYPKKGAFRAGVSSLWDDANIGTLSVSFGNGNKSSADYSVTWGNTNIANATYSTAWGTGTTASGLRATAFGQGGISSGLRATSWGNTSVASQEDATAWGLNSQATGSQSTAWGAIGTIASGGGSTAWGRTNLASGSYSTAWGQFSTASGISSTSWGNEAVASGTYTSAWGDDVKAKGFAGSTMGSYNDSTAAADPIVYNTANRAFEIGIGTTDADRRNAMTVLFSGNVGIGTVTPGKILHTVGTVRHVSLGTATSDTTIYKPLGISSAGDVFPMIFWPGGGAGASTWNGITDPTGDQALTFDAGESSTWTNSNTTEDLFTVNSSTITTSSFLSLNSTSTALAAGNNLIELVMSGANGTSSITANPLRVSVTNTGTTSTNTAASFTASGATNNYAAVFPAGRVGIGTATPSASDLYVTNASTAEITVINSGFNASAALVLQAVSGKPMNLRYITARTQVEWINGASATIWTINYDSHNQGFDMSSTAPTAKIHIGAQAAGVSTAPLKLTTSATLQTTAEAGAFEYSTPQLLFTNGGAQRQEIPQIQQARVSTQYDNTTTTLGTITGLTTTVVAGKTYRFEAILYTTSNVGGGVKFAMAGTATATAIIYECVVIDANVNSAQTRATAIATTVGAVTAVTAAYSKITGTITVNAAGTLLVQAAANVAVGTTSVLIGSTFVITEML
jgi:hypothetical protein